MVAAARQQAGADFTECIGMFARRFLRMDHAPIFEGASGERIGLDDSCDRARRAGAACDIAGGGAEGGTHVIRRLARVLWIAHVSFTTLNQ